MIRVHAIYPLLRIVLLLLVLAAITLPSQAELAGASGNPAISIIYPPANTNLPSGNIIVTVQVRDFQLVDRLGQANVYGQGHIHYFIDVPVPRDPTKPTGFDPGVPVPTANTGLTWTGVEPGRHQFSVELMSNYHTHVSPLAYGTVIVNVVSGEPNTTGALGNQSVVNDPVVPEGAGIVSLAIRNNTFSPSTIPVA
ncbi:MAG: hypothetical protein ACM3KS_00030 [Phycisphaerales bacterium]